MLSLFSYTFPPFSYTLTLLLCVFLFSLYVSLFSYMLSLFFYAFFPVFFLFLHVSPFFRYAFPSFLHVFPFTLCFPSSYTFSPFSCMFSLFCACFPSFPMCFPFSYTFSPFFYMLSPFSYTLSLYIFPFSCTFSHLPYPFSFFLHVFPRFPRTRCSRRCRGPRGAAVFSPWQPRVPQVCHPPDEADPEGPRQRHLHQTPGGGEGEEGQLRPRGLCPRSGDHRSGPRHQGNAEASGLRQPVQPAGHAAHGGDELQNTPRSSLRQSLLCHFSNKRGKPTRTAWSFEACARRGFPAGMPACCSRDGGAQPGEGERGVSSPSAPPSFVLCCL